MRESDLLPDSTKLAMVLEAAADIRHAERALRDIELLQKQEAHGSGRLHGAQPFCLLSPVHANLADGAELLPYRGALVNGIKDNQEKAVDLKTTKKEVYDLLRRYNEFVNPIHIGLGGGRKR